MGHHEEKWLNNYPNSKPLVYKRYVDDIFCLFENKKDSHLFLDYLNKQHPNIKFDPDPEKENGSLPFLDIQIKKRNEGGFFTSVFHKETYTGLLTNYTSFIPSTYKLALIKTLIHRTYKICNTLELFKADKIELENTLKRNSFPPIIINRVIKKYINKVANPDVDTNKDDSIKYFKLPYLGIGSKETKTKIIDLCKKLCKDTKIIISFNVCKIGSFLSTKSAHPLSLQSFVFYKFLCPSCEACYVGETTRHFKVRMDEHLRRDKASHVFKHINENMDCFDKCDVNSFKIIDRASTPFGLKIREAIHVNWLKPALNRQKIALKLTLDF